MNLLNTSDRIKNARIASAAQKRADHFFKVAQSLGYADAQIAYNYMGDKFTQIARVAAPSINAAMAA